MQAQAKVASRGPLDAARQSRHPLSGDLPRSMWALDSLQPPKPTILSGDQRSTSRLVRKFEPPSRSFRQHIPARPRFFFALKASASSTPAALCQDISNRHLEPLLLISPNSLTMLAVLPDRARRLPRPCSPSPPTVLAVLRYHAVRLSPSQGICQPCGPTPTTSTRRRSRLPPYLKTHPSPTHSFLLLRC